LYLIVGVDPGTTIAIAAVDLKGRLVGMWSGRDAGKEKTMEHVRRFGIPCIFASDVARAPDTVAKLAAFANTRLFTPMRDMSQREKAALARSHSPSNTHELDALAAAYKAYHQYENKLRLIDRTMAERGLQGRAEEVKRLAIGGLSVHKALLLFEKKDERKEKAPAPRPAESKRDLLPEMLSIAKSNNELRKAVERLEREKAALLERVSGLERKTSAQLGRDREIRHRDRIISSLKERLTRGRRKSKAKRKPQKDLKGLAKKERQVNLEAIVEGHRYD